MRVSTRVVSNECFSSTCAEIVKVRSVLFQNGDKQPLELPVPQGPAITITEKVYVPVKDHPEVCVTRAHLCVWCCKICWWSLFVFNMLPNNNNLPTEC